MVGVLAEHVWVGLRVSEGEMSEHLVIKGAGIVVTGGVRTVPRIVGYYGSAVEVSRQHEGIAENPLHQSPGLRLGIL